ncbi:MAG: hypothetical protein IJ207_00510 [Treponema sp.]|uniref:hypothetical protein n=1 Tax=Treponema sp. TaxID=166 RepID=UPI0025D25950|nr:hypothetical protein [Treponema sp.]MBQ9280667.1 hypothetical protein [Treponema sp.]
MTNFFKKSLIVFSFSIFHFSFFHALPAVTPSVPDFSGQYVYYRDTSFERESYIGIVYYDETTYGFRYYAPAVLAKITPLPEKNIHILFTVDSKKESLELTGERILSTIQPDDTDLINYIHDFFYEMTKRRQNAGEITSPKTDYQDYAQFGGNVTLYYNPLIPIFNLEKIVSVDKKTVLQIVSAGQLVSQNDQSFAKFTGFDENFKDKNHKFKKDKKAKALEVNYKATENSTEFKAKLDSSWVPVAENLYTLGNVAVLTVNEVSASSENQTDVLKRRLLLGNEFVYPNWQNQKIEVKANGTLFTQVSYHAESDTYTYDFKFLREIDPKTVGLYTLTVYAGAYEPNKKYFNEILASFE